MTAEKNWWFNSYADDIHKHLRFKERNRFLYKGTSPQLNVRPKMVAFIDRVCGKKEYCNTVEHLAIYLMDIFMDNHTIHIDHLQLVSLICLLIAVKLEEQDRLPPKYSEFMPFLVKKYKTSEFISLEASILSFFDWNILFPTAAHFTEYYLLFSLSPNDLLKGKPLSFYDKVDVFLQKYIKYFLDVLIRDHGYIKFAPSLNAAACIATTRRCMLIEPIWPDTLLKITHYSYSQLKACSNLLIKAFDEDLLKQNNNPEEKNNITTFSLKRKRSGIVG